MKEIKEDIVLLPTSTIAPYEGSHNTDEAIEMIKDSLSKFGIQQPIIVDKNRIIVAGNAIYKAALELGIDELPCVVVDDLTEEEVIQYRIADNKTGEFASWNEKKLKQELSYLVDPNELQFCFDDSILSILGIDSSPSIPMTHTTSSSPDNTKEEVVYNNDGEVIDMKGRVAPAVSYNPIVEPKPISVEEKEKSDEKFRQELSEIRSKMSVNKREYIEYICSKCGNKVIARPK